MLTRGGEDYELLFAFRSERNGNVESRLSKRLGLPVRQIGHVTAQPGVRGLPLPESGHHF